jgi:hypothetical protein
MIYSSLRQLPSHTSNPSTGNDTPDTRNIGGSHKRCRAQMTFTFPRFFSQYMAGKGLIPPDFTSGRQPKTLGCASVRFHFGHTHFSGSTYVVGLSRTRAQHQGHIAALLFRHLFDGRQLF